MLRDYARECAQRLLQWYWRVRCRCEWAPIEEGGYLSRLRVLEHNPRCDKWF